MQLLDQSSLSLCEGQHMDLAFQERLDPSVDFYERMAERKSGARWWPAPWAWAP